MRNEVHKALMVQIRQQCQDHATNITKLNELYSLYANKAESTLYALQEFADLIYWHGINEDSELSRSITPSTLISVGILFRNNLDILQLSLDCKEQFSNALYQLAQGESNEN